MNASQLIKSNSPEILTAVAVSGVFTTSYLVGKASFQAAEVIRSNKEQDAVEGDTRMDILKYHVKHTWPLYAPATVSGVITVGCIVFASKGNAKRTTAAVAAYSVTEKAFNEYKEKVVEQIGKNKEQKLRDEIAQGKVLNDPPSKEVIIIGGSNVLCCELYTGRYFRSDMETLRKAQNDINAMIVGYMYVTLEDFYNLIGLSNTTNSDKLGWDSNKMMDMKFSSILTENGEPCLAFEYNYVKPLK